MIRPRFASTCCVSSSVIQTTPKLQIARQKFPLKLVPDSELVGFSCAAGLWKRRCTFCKPVTRDAFYFIRNSCSGGSIICCWAATGG
jgi:hypothetical protein